MVSGGHQTAKKQTLNPTMSNVMPNDNGAKRTKCAGKNTLPKYSSSLEVTHLQKMSFFLSLLHKLILKFFQIKLYRNTHNPSPTTMARPVAKAMAEQGPPGENILQRSTLLQVI
ncbi:hypothetical protein FQA47_002671 [Oryzias melastigma]|uniref:Uncharacterized protein n=1 Tax=Oryzias melastigma TaxID=30732 RepID=A0A834FJ80_ORYME|nr:hypothetical protein FQA47_002671 [Oryzias melastigma]